MFKPKVYFFQKNGKAIFILIRNGLTSLYITARYTNILSQMHKI